MNESVNVCVCGCGHHKDITVIVIVMDTVRGFRSGLFLNDLAVVERRQRASDVNAVDFNSRLAYCASWRFSPQQQDHASTSRDSSHAHFIHEGRTDAGVWEVGKDSAGDMAVHGGHWMRPKCRCPMSGRCVPNRRKDM